MINRDKIKKRIILASASPRRKELMEKTGLDFEVVVSKIDENSICCDTPSAYAANLALSKACQVAADNPDALVIGADTIVVRDTILGKPAHRREAVEMLLKLQGSTHEVITGVALVDAGNSYIRTFAESTCVEMMPLTLNQIEAYVDTGEPMDKAGAYGIQGSASVFIPKIQGCYFNVMGLPLHKLWLAINEYRSAFGL